MCHEAGQSAFLHTQLYLSTNLDHTLLATFLGTNSLSVLMCSNAVNQSIICNAVNTFIGSSDLAFTFIPLATSHGISVTWSSITLDILITTPIVPPACSAGDHKAPCRKYIALTWSANHVTFLLSLIVYGMASDVTQYYMQPVVRVRRAPSNEAWS